jgi:hypothetical protein
MFVQYSVNEDVPKGLHFDSSTAIVAQSSLALRLSSDYISKFDTRRACRRQKRRGCWGSYKFVTLFSPKSSFSTIITARSKEDKFLPMRDTYLRSHPDRLRSKGVQLRQSHSIMNSSSTTISIIPFNRPNCRLTSLPLYIINIVTLTDLVFSKLNTNGNAVAYIHNKYEPPFFVRRMAEVSLYAA